MSKSMLAVCLIILAVFLLFESAEARCRKHDRRCCRRKIEYGRCYNHVRRWAYNVSCGQCVQFDYSGCGGDENNFENIDECQGCCRGTSPCPRYSLVKPSGGCEYQWNDGPDECPRPRLNCNCRPSHCRPDSCRGGQRCIAENRPCNSCPCEQYRCVSDPCAAISTQLRPCEKCVAVPEPRCQQPPCPLIAYRENNCPAPPVYVAPPPAPIYVEPPRYQYQQCQPCQQVDSCSSRRCPSIPRARCIFDQCNCKSFWECDGKSYSDSDCYGGRY